VTEEPAYLLAYQKGISSCATVEILRGLTNDRLRSEIKHMSHNQPSEIPYRILGRTGEKVSAIGLGGWHIGFADVDEQLSLRIIRAAIDGGINFMDNSWDYNEGRSEIRMGKALRDGYRKKVFLMTKIDGRSRKEATQQLEESLRRLQTDCIDLVQHLKFSDTKILTGSLPRKALREH
jgi:aryl-alcohol dehydrogenase-like predicted oxidoreductase